MFAKLTTKMALKKAGLPTNLSMPSYTYDTANTSSKAAKNGEQQQQAGDNGTIMMPFANPFANVSIPPVWNTWGTPAPPPREVAKVRPAVGGRAPTSAGKVRVGEGRECVVVFLRWCGCPCKFLSFFLSFSFPCCDVELVGWRGREYSIY